MAGYIFKKKAEEIPITMPVKANELEKHHEESGNTGTSKILLKPWVMVYFFQMGPSTPYGLYSAFVATANEINFIENIDKVFPKREQVEHWGIFIRYSCTPYQTTQQIQ